MSYTQYNVIIFFNSFNRRISVLARNEWSASCYICALLLTVSRIASVIGFCKDVFIKIKKPLFCMVSGND